jgi:hypothetical protein
MTEYSQRRGFTVILSFLVMITLVFSLLFSQTREIIQTIEFQKKIFRKDGIRIEVGVSGFRAEQK